MANAMTEHSKALRSKTAAKRNKRLQEEGLVKRIGMQLDTPVADEFLAVLAEIGGTRTQAVRELCAVYRAKVLNE